eukprot:Opistho-2@79659
MALNGVPVTPSGGVLIPPGERMMYSTTGVQFSIESGGGYPGNNGSYYGKGDVILTDRRILFVTKPPLEVFKSFALPFELIFDAKLNQPIFGANNFSGKVDPVADAGLAGTGEFKLTFKNGGAAEFATLFLHMNAPREVQAGPPLVNVTAIFQQNGQPAPIHGVSIPTRMVSGGSGGGGGGGRRPLQHNPGTTATAPRVGRAENTMGYDTYPAAAPPPYSAPSYGPPTHGVPQNAADAKAREAGHSTVSAASPSYRPPAGMVQTDAPLQSATYQGAPYNEPPPEYTDGVAYGAPQGGGGGGGQYASPSGVHRYPM